MVSSYQGHLQEPTKATYPLVGEFMARSIAKVTTDMDIYQVMELIIKNNVSGLPVVEDDNVLVGWVSEKDCLKLIAQDTYDAAPSGGPVGNYMSTELITLTKASALSEAADIFMKNPFKKLPVVENGKIVGVVRRHDVLQVLTKHNRERNAYMRTV